MSRTSAIKAFVRDGPWQKTVFFVLDSRNGYTGCACSDREIPKGRWDFLFVRERVTLGFVALRKI